ncbi:F-box/FBD/LRR-repeat protein At1g13780 [Linum perenne]
MKGIDRLSDLPDSILHHILSFADTKSSVQTCILSSRWRSVWKYVDVLSFSQSSFRDDLKFERHVDRVLSLRHDSSSVSRVAVDFSVEDMDRRMDTLMFDRIMRYAASHDVRELFVCASSIVRLMDVVEPVCECYRTLKVLELKEAYIQKDDVRLWSCLQLLESLTLTFCFFTFDDAGCDAFASFPRLETLKLVSCCLSRDSEPSVLNVSGPRLLDLEIHLLQVCTYSNRVSQPSVLKVSAPELLKLGIVRLKCDSLEIVAPKLESFSLKIDSIYNILPDVSKLILLPPLDRANIKFIGNACMFRHTSYSSHYAARKQMLLEWCASLFKILHNVQALDLQIETFELLIQTYNLVKYQASPFKRLKSLSLKYSEGSLDEVPDEVIHYFLGGSPNEEGKRFTVEKLC